MAVSTSRTEPQDTPVRATGVRLKRVLVVDDSPVMRALMCDTLRAAGHDVAEAPDGQQGLNLARERLPDLVLCDINMPVLDGHGFVQAVRADADLRTLPILMVTTESERGAMRRAMDAGADDYLTKPFTSTELFSAVQAQLQRRQRHDDEAEQRLDHLRGAVMHTVPHELRTPLTTILGYSQLMLARAGRLPPERQTEMLRSIHGAAEQLSRTVGRFMEWAELNAQAGRTAPTQQVTPAAVIAELLGSPDFRTRLQSGLPADLAGLPSSDRLIAGRPFRCSLAPAALRADPVALTRILVELLGNAVRFSKPGAPVLLSGVAEGSAYVIDISNHGPALPLQVQRQTGGALMQHDRERQEQQGCGLGLALASLLAERDGGSLQWVRTDGSPNTMRVRVPVAG